jgi:yecA family protein
MLDYRELNNLLENLQSDADAADCHGFICGQICVTEFPLPEIWKEYLDVEPDDKQSITEGLQDLQALVAETMKSFESPDFDFYPMLPDDDTPIDERICALGEWCHGFLNGFAISQEANSCLEDDDSRELIENFTRICHIGVGEEPDQNDEKALFELVEYVRLGAIFMYDQLSMNMPGRAHGVYH